MENVIQEYTESNEELRFIDRHSTEKQVISDKADGVRGRGTPTKKYIFQYIRSQSL